MPERSCDLCGLACGRNPPWDRFGGEERFFCCNGCLNVYSILHESGAIKPGVDFRDSELFQKSLKMGLISQPKEPSKGPDPIPPNTPVSDVMYEVSGMWCASCAWLIEHMLLRERGVASAEVFFASDLVKVRYYPQFLPPDRIPKRIDSLGYKASEYSGSPGRRSSETKELLLRLGVAAFLWINVMTLNVGLYVGYFQEIPEFFQRTLPYVLLVLATPAVFYSAQPILRLAWRGAANRLIRMETLLALGILAAYGYSVVQTFRGSDHVYFDTVCALVALVLVGKVVERGAKDRTARAITMLHDMMPKKARILVMGRERFVAIDALRLNDIFTVKAGERIPADGEIVEGESHVDESLLTGESEPVAKRPGDTVAGGSLNDSGVIRVRAAAVGNDSTLARIVRTVERALGNRAPIEKTVDRVSRAFVPGVIALSLATFGYGWTSGALALDEALMRAVTILVIACPCALGIATPLALTAAVGAASRAGILVSDSTVLETARRVNTIIFDKTGTVTEGVFSLLHIEPEHLQLVGSLEASSEHPLGQAVARAAQEAGHDLRAATDVVIRKGVGIEGRVDGRTVFAGNRRIVPSIESEWEEIARGWERQAATVFFYGWDGQIRGVMALGDRMKPGVPGLIEELKRRQIATLLLSGDSERTTRAVASEIGVDDYRAEALPEEKVAIVDSLKGEGRVVAMVGDGINDAPALATADLGITLGSGTDIAMHAAALVLLNNDLRTLPTAIDLSRRTMRLVYQNLFWAFAYNTVGIALAVAGVLNPIIAAGAMVVSSLSVIVNSMRANRFGGHERESTPH